MTDMVADDICRFWFDEIEHSSWFKKNPEFDQHLKDRFGVLLEQAKRDELAQFSRNIHRDSAEAFAADAKALQLALEIVDKGLDKELTLEQRSFAYLPFRHAEDLAMQKIGLDKTRELNAAGYGSDKYAINHLSLIELFGRFPYRNKALGRSNTPEEEAYLAGS